MTLPLSLALLALAMMVLLLRAVRGQSAAVGSLQELEGRTVPLDLEAFRNLSDPREEEYLRARLTPADFRAIHRERLRAALGYVRRAAHNASILLRLGEAARQNADPEIARAAAKLASTALKLRMYALLAEALLHSSILLSAGRWSPARVVTDYQNLRERVAHLCRLQLPEHAGRITAAL
jgi:hypothetical protein